jgi:hypothetical protein
LACSLKASSIPLDVRFELLQWEQDSPDRTLKIEAKKALPSLLSAQADDASVTEIKLDNVNLTPQCGLWLAKMLKGNGFVQSLE